MALSDGNSTTLFLQKQGTNETQHIYFAADVKQHLEHNNNLSGDGKKASRSSDLTYASDLLDLNPLFSNCVERRSSFSPGDRDFNHEWTSDGPEESNESIDFAIFVQLQHSCFPTTVAINSLRARDQIWR